MSDDNLFRILAALVDEHGLKRVIENLATVCRWKSHRLACHGQHLLSRRWDNIGKLLAWEAALKLKGL